MTRDNILNWPAMPKKIVLEKYPNRIRELRTARGLNLEELGGTVGMTKTHMSRLEMGQRPLTLEWMQRIARALDVTTAELLNPEDNPTSGDPQLQGVIKNWLNADEKDRRTIEIVSDSVTTYRDGPKILPFPS